MKKEYFLIFVLLVLGLLSFNFVQAKNNTLPLFGKVIYLDPAHGGLDPGAMYKDIMEKDINLKIALNLERKLESLGAIVYLTRYGDYDLASIGASLRKRSDLSRRANIINDSNCDLYMSLHLNSVSSKTWYGAQTFFDDINEKNELLAKTIQESFQKHLHTPREYKETDTMYLHKRVKVPGILIEVGFLSNPNERYLLSQETYYDKVSNAIIEGLIKYFKIS